MEKDNHTRPIQLISSKRTMTRVQIPFMGFVFIKALCLSLFRPNTISGEAIVEKNRMVLNNYRPDLHRLAEYKKVCGFAYDRPDSIPISFFQTLFTGMLGELITSPGFPVNPLGLVHIFQSFDLKRPVKSDETIDLVCTLSGMRKTPKGIETDFTQEVMSGSVLLWKGVSTFLTKHSKPVLGKKKSPSNKGNNLYLKKTTPINVPAGTGREYAKVSGDYNPHHLYPILAKPFGFKKAIAHGMWSLSSVIARLGQQVDVKCPMRVEAFFKRPIFMPAVTVLGHDFVIDGNSRRVTVKFELFDQIKAIPHLRGKLVFPG